MIICSQPYKYFKIKMSTFKSWKFYVSDDALLDTLIPKFQTTKNNRTYHLLVSIHYITTIVIVSSFC